MMAGSASSSSLSTLPPCSNNNGNGRGDAKPLLTCLICGQQEPRDTFITHISEHLHYRPHQCADCEFCSVTVEQMADHEAATEHVGQLFALRNKYLERMCRFVYNDCEFGDKNGGLEKVLMRRKLVSTVEDEQQQPPAVTAGQGIVRQALVGGTTMMKAEGECAKVSSISNSSDIGCTSATAAAIDGAGGDQQHRIVGQTVQQWLQQQQQHHHHLPFDAATSAVEHHHHQQQQQQFYVHSSSSSSGNNNNNNNHQHAQLPQRGGVVDELKLEQLLLGNVVGGVGAVSAATGDGQQQQQYHQQRHHSNDHQSSNNFLSSAEEIAAAAAAAVDEQQHEQDNILKLVTASSSATTTNACSSMLQQFIAQQQSPPAPQQRQALVSPHFDGIVDQYIHGGQPTAPPPLQMANGCDAVCDQQQQPKTTTKCTSNNNKPSKQVYENVQCLKCRQWVKGRGICLLYHMNTRHLKLPLYRCLACPRDFFYVTDTTAKNHIRSFHGNDLTLLENNYHTYSGLLHGSRREFFGAALRGSEARTQRAATRKERPGAGSARGAVAAAASLKGRACAMPKQISLRDRPQSGSGPGGSSSHVQCLQCGEFVASIYSSQLTHMNTKHLHMAVFTCRLCGRAFESLSSSAAIMHVKSAHGRERCEAEAEIVEQRGVCLKELNERYRTFFS